MKGYKKWWILLAIAAFVLMNLLLNHHAVKNPGNQQLRNGQIGTH